MKSTYAWYINRKFSYFAFCSNSVWLTWIHVSDLPWFKIKIDYSIGHMCGTSLVTYTSLLTFTHFKTSFGVGWRQVHRHRIVAPTWHTYRVSIRLFWVHQACYERRGRMVHNCQTTNKLEGNRRHFLASTLLAGMETEKAHLCYSQQFLLRSCYS